MLDFKLTAEEPKLDISGGLYDMLIIGGGPAGLTAAIYGARDGMKVLVLEKEGIGGLAGSTELIENYPGFPQGISGAELMERFRAQAERFGTEIIEFEEVTKIEPTQKGLINVHTGTNAVHQGKTVIIATGSVPKKLNVPGEKDYYGRGVSYCATCDGPLFKGKKVVVVGAGNSGLQEGVMLLEYAESVDFIEFLPHSIAEKILQDRTMNHPKSRFFFSHRLTEIKGDGNQVTSVLAKDRNTDEVKEIPADGVFIYVGYAPYTKFVEDLLDLNKWGYIKTDEKMRTSMEGIYAVGDVRANNPAQVSISVGDGTKAVLDIREYIQDLKE